MTTRLTSRIRDTIKVITNIALVFSAAFLIYYLAILFAALIILMGGHLTI
jgi:hypothetical protein